MRIWWWRHNMIMFRCDYYDYSFMCCCCFLQIPFSLSIHICNKKHRQYQDSSLHMDKQCFCFATLVPFVTSHKCNLKTTFHPQALDLNMNPCKIQCKSHISAHPSSISNQLQYYMHWIYYYFPPKFSSHIALCNSNLHKSIYLNTFEA